MTKVTAIAALAGVVATIGMAGTAHADYTLTFTQVGADVIATGSGSINAPASSILPSSDIQTDQVFPGAAAATIGSDSSPYETLLSAELGQAFGGDKISYPSSGSGDFFGFNADIYLPKGYVSGSMLSSSATFKNETFAEMELTPGTYGEIFSYGNIVTVQVGPVAPPPNSVPEPATLALLALPLGAAGLMAARRRKAS